MMFYDCLTAPSPRRARMFIAEKGLDIETKDINLGKGEQLLPEFLAINSRATVPVLVTDDQVVLTENIAIATYLEELHPTPPLMGVTPAEKASISMWNAIVEQHGLASIAEALRNGNPHMKGRAITGQADFEQIPELAERGMARTAMFFDMVESQLKVSPFIASEGFSMADITAFVAVDFARVIKVRIPENHAATLAWFKRIKERPSANI